MKKLLLKATKPFITIGSIILSLSDWTEVDLSILDSNTMRSLRLNIEAGYILASEDVNGDEVIDKSEIIASASTSVTLAEIEALISEKISSMPKVDLSEVGKRLENIELIYSNIEVPKVVEVKAKEVDLSALATQESVEQSLKEMRCLIDPIAANVDKVEESLVGLSNSTAQILASLNNSDNKLYQVVDDIAGLRVDLDKCRVETSKELESNKDALHKIWNSRSAELEEIQVAAPNTFSGSFNVVKVENGQVVDGTNASYATFNDVELIANKITEESVKNIDLIKKTNVSISGDISGYSQIVSGSDSEIKVTLRDICRPGRYIAAAVNAKGQVIGGSDVLHKSDLPKETVFIDDIAGGGLIVKSGNLITTVKLVSRDGSILIGNSEGNLGSINLSVAKSGIDASSIGGVIGTMNGGTGMSSVGLPGDSLIVSSDGVGLEYKNISSFSKIYSGSYSALNNFPIGIKKEIIPIDEKIILPPGKYIGHYSLDIMSATAATIRLIVSDCIRSQSVNTFNAGQSMTINRTFELVSNGSELNLFIDAVNLDTQILISNPALTFTKI